MRSCEIEEGFNLYLPYFLFHNVHTLELVELLANSKLRELTAAFAFKETPQSLYRIQFGRIDGKPHRLKAKIFHSIDPIAKVGSMVVKDKNWFDSLWQLNDLSEQIGNEVPKIITVGGFVYFPVKGLSFNARTESSIQSETCSCIL